MASDHEAVRYRQAAHLALDQLQWCVDYLRTIRKTRLSEQVARNRTALIRKLHEIDDRTGHHT
jgi:hypothetical protein